MRGHRPQQPTLKGYSGLSVDHVNLLDGSKVSEREFDQLMDRLLTEDGTFVVDNGSSSFLPLSNYLVENRALEMLQEAGRRTYLHTIVTGGQAIVDTVHGFNEVASKMATDKSVVVWLNEFFGHIERGQKTFPEMAAYTKNASKVAGLVQIAKRNQDTFGRDIESMAAQRLTFRQVQGDGVFSIMARQRLRTVERDLFAQLDDINFS